MSEEKVEQPVEKPNEIVQIDDIHHMVTILTTWHEKKVAILEHMREIPEKTVMVLDDDTKIVMEGKFLDGFKAGVQLGLMELGTLPFAVETPAVEATDAATKE
jgi:hypothetical protein